MQIKLKDIVEDVENINKLLDNKLPVKVSYRLKKLITKLKSELDPYTETRNALILELGTKQEDGTYAISIKDETYPDYVKKINELLDQDIEIDFEPIDVDELGDIVVSPNELVEWIFK